tara:strand:+ start:16 stop:1830 length:1815 start_codon:yes stop_codon:yes gene_type:complete
MSGFYDDGGVTFAKEQFDNVRKRKEKEAKKQDKAAQKLLLADLAVKGFNMSLNNKYEKLAQEALFEKSAYFTAIEDSKNFLNFYNEEKAKGFSDDRIYRNAVLGEYQNYFGEGYVVDGIEGLVDDFVSSGNNFQNYKNMIEHHKKVAGINPDELKAYIRTGVKAPRNLGELIGNKIKKISMSHTNETLKNKDTKIKNQEINKIDLLGFGNLKNSLQQYEGSSMTALRKVLEENSEKYKPYKIQNIDEVFTLTIDGNQVPHMIQKRTYKNGTYIHKIIPITELAKPVPEKDLTSDEIDMIIANTSSKVYDIIDTMSYAEDIVPGIKTDIKEIKEDPVKNKDEQYSTMMSIHKGQEYIMKTHSSLVKDPNLAYEIATISSYRNRQMNIDSSRPTLFDIELITAFKTGSTIEVERVTNWLEDIEKNYGIIEQDIIRNSMLKELPQYFDEEADRDALNAILEAKKLPSLDNIEGDIEENYIDNWNNLDNEEKKQYRTDRDSLFMEIKNELKDEIKFSLGGVIDIINESNSFYSTTLKTYFNNLTSDEQQQYGGVMPKTGLFASDEENENYKNLVSDFKTFFMSKVEDLNISEGNFDASFYINNYKILK